MGGDGSGCGSGLLGVTSNKQVTFPRQNSMDPLGSCCLCMYTRVESLCDGWLFWLLLLVEYEHLLVSQVSHLHIHILSLDSCRCLPHTQLSDGRS